MASDGIASIGHHVNIHHDSIDTIDTINSIEHECNKITSSESPHVYDIDPMLASPCPPEQLGVTPLTPSELRKTLEQQSPPIAPITPTDYSVCITPASINSSVVNGSSRRSGRLRRPPAHFYDFTSPVVPSTTFLTPLVKSSECPVFLEMSSPGHKSTHVRKGLTVDDERHEQTQDASKSVIKITGSVDDHFIRALSLIDRTSYTDSLNQHVITELGKDRSPPKRRSSMPLVGNSIHGDEALTPERSVFRAKMEARKRTVSDSGVSSLNNVPLIERSLPASFWDPLPLQKLVPVRKSLLNITNKSYGQAGKRSTQGVSSKSSATPLYKSYYRNIQQKRRTVTVDADDTDPILRMPNNDITVRQCFDRSDTCELGLEGIYRGLQQPYQGLTMTSPNRMQFLRDPLKTTENFVISPNVNNISRYSSTLGLMTPFLDEFLKVTQTP